MRAAAARRAWKVARAAQARSVRWSGRRTILEAPVRAAAAHALGGIAEKAEGAMRAGALTSVRRLADSADAAAGGAGAEALGDAGDEGDERGWWRR